MKKITIKEIARQANVSTATVSRVLNGHFEKMSVNTRKKVEEIISQNNFFVNRQAQSLKAKSTHLIGMVVADVENYFSTLLFKGADQVFANLGYQIILMNSNNSSVREQNQLKELLELQVDGIIFQPLSSKSSDYRIIQASATPIVMIDRFTDNHLWPVVTTDNYAYSKILAMLLIHMKYDNILVVSESLRENVVRLKRYQAVEDAVKNAGTKSELIEVNPTTTAEKLYSQIALKTDSFKGKSVIYALKGSVLRQVRGALAKFRIRIPTEIGLVAFDDWNISEYMDPQVTTIQQDPNMMGRKAAELIVNQLQGDTVMPVIYFIESKLQVRQSLV